MKVRKSIFGLIFFLGFSVLTSTVISTNTVYAATQAECEAQKEGAGFLSFPTWYKYLDVVEKNGDCEIALDPATVNDPNAQQNPEVVATSIGKILLAVFEILLRLGGLAAVGFVMYGGFQYLISQGEPDRTKGARTTILNALIGLVIMMSATAIVNIIGRNLT